MIYTYFNWDWPTSSEEDFFLMYASLRMVFPILAPSDPLWPRCEQFWIYIISESFHLNMTYFGSVVLEKKLFSGDPTPFFHFCDHLHFEEDLTLYLNNKFDWNWPTGSGEEDFTHYKHMWIWFSHYDPSRPPGTMTWTICWIYIYQKAFKYIWYILAQWFLRKRFLIYPTSFLHSCDYLLFQEDLAIYLNNLEFALP
jgi:hypothetical protein